MFIRKQKPEDKTVTACGDGNCGLSMFSLLFSWFVVSLARRDMLVYLVMPPPRCDHYLIFPANDLVYCVLT